MSWIVQNLLTSSPWLKINPDLESDDFNNLLVIEAKIAELINNGAFQPQEIRIISLLTDGRSLGQISKDIGLNRNATTKRINAVCHRIAFCLGGEFTDDGFLSYMQSKYKLGTDEMVSLRKYIAGKYSRKLMRTPKK